MAKSHQHDESRRVEAPPPATASLARRCAVELIGTFFFVLVIGLTVVGKTPGDGVIPAIAIGFVLTVMVYAGGHISGGHYNPAVTLAAFVRGRCAAADVVPYMIAQFAGSALAAYLTIYLVGHAGAPADPPPDETKSFIVEALFNFALAYVVLNTATSRANAGNSFYGLAIGATVMVAVFAAGGISGGAFNPAIAVGITLMKLATPAHLVTLLLADFLGGALAGVAYRLLVPDDK